MWLDKLNSLKKECGKTIKDIAQDSGIPIGTLNKLFAGQTQNPKLDTVRAVVHSLGYTLDDLFELPAEEQEKDPSKKGEVKLVHYYRELNQEGQEKLLDYADDLATTGKYKKVGAFRVDAKEA